MCVCVCVCVCVAAEVSIVGGEVASVGVMLPDLDPPDLPDLIAACIGICMDVMDSEPIREKEYGLKRFFIMDLMDRMYDAFLTQELHELKGQLDRQGLFQGIIIEGYHKGGCVGRVEEHGSGWGQGAGWGSRGKGGGAGQGSWWESREQGGGAGSREQGGGAGAGWGSRGSGQGSRG